MSEQVPLFEIDWGREEIQNVVDSVTRGGYWAKGPYVTEFEEAIESYLGVEHAITYNSGTTALVGALKAAGIGEGDEVIVPSFTFIATANAVRLVGADPIFADIESERFGLDPASVRDAITDRTTAILPVHVYGKPFLMDELVAIADDHDLLLIEDAAEAFGARENGTMAGTVGDMAALSFCQNKVVATGEGGAVVTDDDELARCLELYRSHGRASSDYFDSTDSGDYVDIGTNVRMADVVAAIGAGQMERVDSIIERRRTVAEMYREALADVDGVTTPTDPPNGRHVYQIYTVTFDSSALRQDAIDALSERNISSKVYWDPPVHRTTYYQESSDTTNTHLPSTDDISERVLSLPMHPNLTASEIERVATTLRDTL